MKFSILFLIFFATLQTTGLFAQAVADTTTKESRLEVKQKRKVFKVNYADLLRNDGQLRFQSSFLFFTKKKITLKDLAKVIRNEKRIILRIKNFPPGGTFRLCNEYSMLAEKGGCVEYDITETILHFCETTNSDFYDLKFSENCEVGSQSLSLKMGERNW